MLWSNLTIELLRWQRIHYGVYSHRNISSAKHNIPYPVYAGTYFPKENWIKILGTLSQFSLGVSGIKQETAEQIELYAQDPTSNFYPGDAYAQLLVYPEGVDHSQELYKRLTDSKNHYYSYLYTALFIKEIEAHWSRAGFPLDQKPEIIGTLFNIGFKGSSPKSNPQTAGAGISTGGTTYSFGELTGMFANSQELRAQFPF